MSKIPSQLADERGFFTLPVPKPGFFNGLNKFRLYRKVVHRLLYFKLRYAHSGRTLILFAAATVGLVSLSLLAGFFMPKTLALSFGQDNCLFNPQILPGLTDHNDGDTFGSSSKPLFSIAGQPLVSFETCIHASAAPTADSTEQLTLVPFGNPLLKKTITVHTGALPVPNIESDTSEAIGTSSSLNFTFDQPDRIFNYQLRTSESSADCVSADDSLICLLKPLGLRPGAAYQIDLVRVFDGSDQGVVATVGITTLDPVVLARSTVAEGATVYDAPRSINLVFNKPLKSDFGDVSLITSADGVPLSGISLEISGTSVVVSFPELTRSTAYKLHLDQLVAEDSSMLELPLTINFTMSGGPKVVSTSIGSYKVALGSNVTVNFDVGLAAGQDLNKFASIVTSSGPVTAKVTADGHQLSINPASDLPRCTPFTVKIAAGLVNQYGIGGGEAWEYRSKTICQSAFSIGKSVQGRSITGYRFGNGPSKIVYVGGMHGNEKSSVATLNAWVDYLEQNAEKLPGHRSIIVIPNHNPDGYAGSRRTNANNVDLNRNFPSNDWASSIQMPGNQNLPQGGGVSPLDQPESSALASFIQSENPRLVLTYHAVAKVVISNDAGDSVSLAQKYASDSGYPFTSNASSGGTFEYATTGEFEDWLADKEGVAGILVELAGMTSNQFSTHRSAMWNLTQIP